MQKKIAALFFAGALMSFMCWSVVSYAAKKAGDFIENADRAEAIDWGAIYPFEGEQRVKVVEEHNESPFEFIRKRCEDYTTNKLLGYQSVVETLRTYEELIGWNAARIVEYNGVVKLKDGYFTTFAARTDVNPQAEAITALASYCEGKGIGFFYGNFPVKVCKYEDSDVSGKLDFANQNADGLLELLEHNGVKYLDFRGLLHEEGMKHHEAFFRTDHHWKPETGLWAARHILQYLKEAFGWNVDPNVLDPDRFRYAVYPEWFLGSQGKKITLARTDPENFTLIYPYYKDPFRGYNHGRRDFVRLTNMLAGNNKKLLLIDDSFCNAVTPFLALGVRQVEALDLRQFTGSVKSFIEDSRPDFIAVLYNGHAIGGSVLYDFR